MNGRGAPLCVISKCAPMRSDAIYNPSVPLSVFSVPLCVILHSPLKRSDAIPTYSTHYLTASARGKRVTNRKGSALTIAQASTAVTILSSRLDVKTVIITELNRSRPIASR